ncbi:MAG: glycosyltransferase family 4 protein [Pseudomonadota bacterium]|nr:glycosyltransferase family 4 protein [Pseudomonadota bacterium]
MRILCLTHTLPYPATTGGNQRTALLLRALAQHGPTDLIQVCRYGPTAALSLEGCRQRFNLIAAVEPTEPGTYKPWNLIRPLQPVMVDRLARALGDQTIVYRPDPKVMQVVREAMQNNHYDAIVSRYLYPVAMAGLLNQRNVPVLVDLDDVDHVVARDNTDRSTPLVRRLVYSMQRPQIERAVPPLLNAASHLWVSATDDVPFLGSSNYSVLPNIPYSESDEMIDPCPPTDDSKRILFVGMLSYKPNSEGLEHFISRCWPRIRSVVPDATLRIVGNGLDARTRARWTDLPGIDVAGFVSDLRAEYQRCAFAIVPAQRGGGTKIKAIECFAYGRTCVVTPHSHRGIEGTLRHRESLWRGSDDGEFAEGCAQLLTKADFRHSLAEKGRQLVNENYTVKRFQSVIGAALEGIGLLKKPSPPPLSLYT